MGAVGFLAFEAFVPSLRIGLGFGLDGFAGSHPFQIWFVLPILVVYERPVWFFQLILPGSGVVWGSDSDAFLSISNCFDSRGLKSYVKRRVPRGGSRVVFLVY